MPCPPSSKIIARLVGFGRTSALCECCDLHGSVRHDLECATGLPAIAVAAERRRQDAELGIGSGPVGTWTRGHDAKERVVAQSGGIEADRPGERSGHRRHRPSQRTTEQAGERDVRLGFGSGRPVVFSRLSSQGCARRIDRVRPWAGSAVRVGAGPAVSACRRSCRRAGPRSAPILAAASRQRNDSGHSRNWRARPRRTRISNKGLNARGQVRQTPRTPTAGRRPVTLPYVGPSPSHAREPSRPRETPRLADTRGRGRSRFSWRPVQCGDPRFGPFPVPLEGDVVGRDRRMMPRPRSR
jgi:hypothetical protein